MIAIRMPTSDASHRLRTRDPRRPPVGPESPPGGDRMAGLRVPPPCFIGRLVHRMGRSTPVDGSLPCFANLASARRYCMERTTLLCALIPFTRPLSTRVILVVLQPPIFFERICSIFNNIDIHQEIRLDYSGSHAKPSARFAARFRTLERLLSQGWLGWTAVR